ncbi:MAG: type II secretion system protein [Verrucomicrobiales bacterium]|nr:type II secretion system protein [Verrucomicrobiales bacterium]
MKIMRSVSRGSLAGFTLLEIAVSLAVIGFAIVAVIGVLPTGLNIQRDTRERTIVMQDATYFLEAIRQGARGTNDLVNNVERIWVAYEKGAENPPRLEEKVRGAQFTKDSEVIEFLTLPRVANQSEHLYSVALVRSLSGTASEKGSVSGDDRIAFSYFLLTEVVPITSVPDAAFTTTEILDARERMHRTKQKNTFANNLSEVRLTIMWPPSPSTYTHGWVPRNQITLRTYVSGALLEPPQRVLNTSRFQ